MLTFIIKELTTSDHPLLPSRSRRHIWPKTLYAIKDRDFCLYVGMSDADVEDRFLQHLGQSRNWPSSRDEVGMHIHFHSPRSLKWIVEFWSSKEVFHRFNRGAKVADEFLPHLTRKAESLLRLYYQPPLNRQGNPGWALPRRYRIHGPTPDQLMKEGRPIKRGEMIMWKNRWWWRGKIWEMYHQPIADRFLVNLCDERGI